MKRIHNILAVIQLAASISLGQSLSLSISMEKDQCMVGEEVFVECVLSNLTQAEVTFAGFYPGSPYFTLELVGAGGAQVRYNGPNVEYTAAGPYRFTIPAKGQALRQVTLAVTHGTFRESSMKLKVPFLHGLDVGNYSLAVSYRPNPSSVPVRSNSINFHVAPPTGENKNVYDRCYAYFKDVYSNKSISFEEKDARLHDLIKEVGTSPYCPVLHISRLRLANNWKAPSESNELALSIIDTLRETPYAIQALEMIKLNRSERVALNRTLSKKYSKGKLGRYIQQARQ